jgi:outer membrane protein OmpA-like peptidoglycan-associated protein
MKGDLTVNSNLMTELMNDFRGDSLSSVASAVGESPATTHSAIAAALPALIGGLAYKASTTDQASNLLDVITRNKLDSDTFATPSSAVRAPGGLNSLMNVGRPLLDSVFGNRSAAINDWVASRSGVSRSSSSSLLSIALPIVLGLIAKRVRSTGWNASNLMRLMGDQRAYLQDAPAGLASVLSGDEATTTRHARTDTEDMRRRHPPAAPAYETAPRNRHAWLWALPLLLLIPLVGYFLARHNEPRRDVAVQSRPAPQEAVPAVPEEKPVGTSSEPAALPAGTGPYQLRFATGSQTLTAESSQQLRDIVDIMRTHPRAKAEIKGYTDNAGNDAANMELSQNRAMAVMNEIADLGIDRSRMTAEGYGEASPVATNATSQGRQQNRRDEVELTDR